MDLTPAPPATSTWLLSSATATAPERARREAAFDQLSGRVVDLSRSSPSAGGDAADDEHAPVGEQSGGVALRAVSMLGPEENAPVAVKIDTGRCAIAVVTAGDEDAAVGQTYGSGAVAASLIEPVACQVPEGT
jgi:hypothetical protein